MQKPVLAVALLAAISSSALAQTRLSLYEEFSGENCAPCAATNPGLWARVQAAPSKVLLLKYQVPIPSAGPLYNRNPTDAATRANYYTINSAPNGRADGGLRFTGIGTTSAGHPALYLADSINAAAAVASPFNITVTHNFSSDYDSVFATINVTCVTNYAPTGASMKLQTAFVATMEYPTAPGTNGEKEFHNVVQKMYPSAAGTSIANSWTAGQTQTFTISGPIQNYVDLSNHSFVAAWIQNDADKSVAQAAKSTFVPMNLDAAITSISVPKIACALTATTPVAATAVLTNKGTTTLTSATINYRLSNGTFQQYAWTGSLAANASTNITMPALSVGVGGFAIMDSVSAPNGQTDYNRANNSWLGVGTAINTTPNPLPITTSFENNGADPANWTRIGDDKTGANWIIASASNGNIGYNSTKYVAWYPNYQFDDGSASYMVLPAPQLQSGAKTLDFYVAYAQIESANNDRLDVMYTTDCGTTWTSIWNKSGSALSTRAPLNTANFIPASNSDWRLEQVDASNVPAGSLFAFRAISDGGNYLFVDSVNFHMKSTQAVADLIVNGQVRVYPNPARDLVHLEYTLGNAGTVQTDIVDVVGHTVLSNGSQKLAAGTQNVDFNTASLPAGVYSIRIQTEQGTHVERFSVVK